MDFRNLIAAAVAAALPSPAQLPAEEIAGMLETPPNPELGDFAFPCFKLAKALRKAPPLIAADLAAAVKLPEGVEKAVTAGAYVNFTLDRAAQARAVLERIDRVQTFVTCTDVSDLAGARQGAVYHVENGCLRAE